MTTKYSPRGSQEAFSLVEIVITLGIVSFACITLLGLLANGLVTVNHAVGNTIGAEIVQAVINESQVNSYSSGFTTTLYFDNEGSPVPVANAVYGATVTAIPLAVPLANTAPTPDYNQASSACMLQVAVTNRTNPGVTNLFSLVWSNSGK